MIETGENRPALAASVVIPLHQDAATIGAMLEHLAAQRDAPAFEVIVVDDGSTDNGPETARRFGAQVIRQRNRGPAAARNRGAAAARGDLLLFLDADCLPPPNWVAEMVVALQQPSTDAVMGTIRPSNSGIVPAFVQVEIEERYARMRASPDSVDFIAAPSCGLRRAVFHALGGFDEGLRYAEDVELAYRLRAHGKTIRFVDSVPAAHLHQTDWRSFLSAKLHRALGRAEVLARYPEKAASDRWTPAAVKAQFLLALVAPVLVLLGFLASPWFFSAAAGGVVALVLTGRRIIAAAARELAAQTPGAARSRPGPAQWAAAVLYGSFFLLSRAFLVVAAVLTVAFRRARRLVGNRPPSQPKVEAAPERRTDDS